MQLKKTLKESIGEFWYNIRGLCTLGVMGSGFVYGLWSQLAGYLLLLGSCLMLAVLSGREYMIASLYRIRTILELRERLIVYGDNEYILRQILQEQAWRGEEPNPEVVKHLENYEKVRAEFQTKLLDMISKLPVETKTEAN